MGELGVQGDKKLEDWDPLIMNNVLGGGPTVFGFQIPLFNFLLEQILHKKE